MSSYFKFTFLLAFLLAIPSCTMEKRLYQKGYHLEWKKKHSGTHSRETNDLVSAGETEDPLEIPVEKQEAAQTEAEKTADLSSSEETRTTHSDRYRFLATESEAPPGDDTVLVQSPDPQTLNPEESTELRAYNNATLLIAALLVALIAVVVVRLIIVVSAPAGLLGIFLFLILALFVLSAILIAMLFIRYRNRPDRAREWELEKEKSIGNGFKKENEPLSHEAAALKKSKKKKHALIFFAVLAVFLIGGLLIGE